MKIALINPSVKGSLKKENLGLANLAAALEAEVGEGALSQIGLNHGAALLPDPGTPGR